MSLPTILIFRIGQLGDTLVALPAIQAIAEKHPNSHRVLLTDRHATASGFVSSWDVLRSTGLINEVVFYSPGNDSALGRLRQVIALVIQLRGHQFQYVYNLTMRIHALALARDQLFFHWIIGARDYRTRELVTYPPPKDASGHLPRLSPEWQRALRVVDPDSSGVNYQLPIPDDARAELASIYPHIESATVAVAIGPGSKMPAKLWPEDRYAALGKRLLAYYPSLRLFIVGGPEDRALGDRLCAAWEGRGVNMAGRLTVYGSAALMERCALFVGNDTGTLHMAAMVGVRCVALFTARDYPGLWEPYGSGHSVLRKDIDCAGCMLQTCVERDSACLKQITVEEALAVTLAQLQRVTQPPGRA